MTKILFVPFSVLGGLLAGAIGKKLFTGIWGLVDEQEAPKPDREGVPWPKLVIALILEGAIFRLVRGAADRGSRELFTRVTGSWPGDEQAQRSN